MGMTILKVCFHFSFTSVNYRLRKIGVDIPKDTEACMEIAQT